MDRITDDESEGSGIEFAGADVPRDARGGPGAKVEEHEIRLDPSAVLRILTTIAAAFLLLSVVGQALVVYAPDFALRDSIANLFLLDWEQNVPTLFSTLMLLACALLLAAIARARRGEPYARHWIVLSIVFSLLSLDEYASLHEAAVDRVRSLLDIRGGPLFFAWVIPGALLGAAFGVAFLPFLRALPRATLRRFAIAAVLFVGGAIGFEMIGSARFAVTGTTKDWAYIVASTLEEGLEMIGAATFLSALLAYIVWMQHPGWAIRMGGTVAGEAVDLMKGRAVPKGAARHP